VAYGLLASRIVCVIQDFYVMRLAKARGWVNPRIWMNVLVQGVVGGVFGLAYLFIPADSWWLLVPAVLHGVSVFAWLVRQQIGKVLREKTTRWPLLRRISNSALLRM